MSDISIQFHALPSELVPLVKEFVVGRNIYVVGMSFPPFSATEIWEDQLEEAILNGPYRRFAFTLRRPEFPILVQTDFLEKNPCAMILDVARPTSNGLRQSKISCRSFDLPMPDEWGKFARRLRLATSSGATALNPDTGATTFTKNFRYTSGAKALHDSGVPMLPIAGGTVLKLGKGT